MTKDEGHHLALLLDEKLKDLAKQTDLDHVKNDVETLKNNVSVLSSDVVGLKKDVSGLKDDVGGLKNDVGNLKTDVSGLKKDVAGLKKDMVTVKADIRDIRSKAATKDQLSAVEKNLRQEFRHEVQVLRKDLKDDIHELREDMIGMQEGITNILMQIVDRLDDTPEIEKIQPHSMSDINHEVVLPKNA